MSAELIAKVVADLKAGRITPIGDEDPESGLDDLNEDTTVLAQWATVVDSTEVWKRFMADENGRMVYETHRICPPWDNCFVAFVNGFNNVELMSVRAIDIMDDEGMWAEKIEMIDHWASMSGTHEIEWDKVRWILHIALYLGGRTSRAGTIPEHSVPTHGPMHAWRVAVYPDGEIADINWIQLRQHAPVDTWDAAMMVLLDTFNMLNCVNVEIAEPKRPRPQARRLSRMGVTVNEIHVKPTSKSYRGMGTPLSAIPSSPLSSVRGHFATYGMNGRGKLFGKYTGRYWIPQHIRGSETLGVSEQEYLVEP